MRAARDGYPAAGKVVATGAGYFAFSDDGIQVAAAVNVQNGVGQLAVGPTQSPLPLAVTADRPADALATQAPLFTAGGAAVDYVTSTGDLRELDVAGGTVTTRVARASALGLLASMPGWVAYRTTALQNGLYSDINLLRSGDTKPIHLADLGFIDDIAPDGTLTVHATTNVNDPAAAHALVVAPDGKTLLSLPLGTQYPGFLDRQHVVYFEYQADMTYHLRVYDLGTQSSTLLGTNVRAARTFFADGFAYWLQHRAIGDPTDGIYMASMQPVQ